jgi:uncharacterized protein YecE (DUF72 family)
MQTIKANIHIGAQGWNYDDWIGSFYPPRTSKKDLLQLYSRIFDTVEIDSTFYAIPPENAVRGWLDRTPKDFIFSLKLPSEITHKNRLVDSQEILDQFAQRTRLFGDRLGSILIQMPPDFSPAERKSFSRFLEIIPGDLRFSIEFRDPKWLTENTIDELREHNVALALVDSKWIDRELSLKLIDQPTAQFSYVRWLGPRELTDFSRIQIERREEMDLWKEGFERLSQKVSVIYGYFNNHYQGHSPESSNRFKNMLGLPIVSPESLIVQPSLF